MSTNSNQNKAPNSRMPGEGKNTVLEAVCRCDRSYFDYLRDIRSDDLEDSCDYCAAFMLA